MPTVSQMKYQHMRVLRDKPAEGTMTRSVYDYFQANRGKVVPPPLHLILDARPKRRSNKLQTIILQLNNFYGLDIRNLGPLRWCLCGEYQKGAIYTDYVAENHDK